MIQEYFNSMSTNSKLVFISSHLAWLKIYIHNFLHILPFWSAHSWKSRTTSVATVKIEFPSLIITYYIASSLTLKRSECVIIVHQIARPFILRLRIPQGECNAAKEKERDGNWWWWWEFFRTCNRLNQVKWETEEEEEMG